MEQTVLIVYIVNIFFCILIMSLLLYHGIKVYGFQHASRIYTWLIVCNITSSALDIVYMMANKGVLIVQRNVLFTIMTAYFIVIALSAVIWSCYAAEIRKSTFFYKNSSWIYVLLPFYFYVLAVLASYWNGWIFFIDQAGIYHRGKWFLLQYFIPYGYILAASIKAFQSAFAKENFLYRTKYLILASFIAAPAIGGGIQLFYQDLPFLTMGTTLVLVVLYMQMQNERVSIDPLTQINNRFQIMQMLTNKVNGYDGKKALWLFMMDVDCFKTINDTYGHIEGDAALVRVADVLKTVCIGHDYFTGRYGGDEFMLIAELTRDELPEAVGSQIQLLVEQANRKAGVPYKISISIGYARYTESFCDIVRFIEEADEELYKIKKARHKSKHVV